ncbi:MAG: hypothetical protein WDZ94_05305 [Patescibacteria group bacterium]
MKKLFTIIVFLSLFISYFQTVPVTYAQSVVSCTDPAGFALNYAASNTAPAPNENIPANSIDSFVLALQGNRLENGGEYGLRFRNSPGSPVPISTATAENQLISFQVNRQNHPSVLSENGQKTLQVVAPGGEVCDVLRYTVVDSVVCEVVHIQNQIENPSCIDNQSDVTIVTRAWHQGDNTPFTGNAELVLSTRQETISFGNTGTHERVVSSEGLDPGSTYNINVFSGNAFNIPSFAPSFTCNRPMAISSIPCTEESQQPPPGSNQATAFELCNQIPDGELKNKCEACTTSGDNKTWTAIGCIENQIVPTTQRLIELGIGLGGGIALLTTIAAGFLLTTSQGDPQRANQAKEMMTAAVVGLLFIIFSVVILQFIGVTIFKIPGFGAETGTGG